LFRSDTLEEGRLRIKAQGLLNAAKWVEDEYGRDTLGEVLRACSPEVRNRYTSVIAIDWHPAAEFIEFVQHAERILGAGHARGRIAEAIGAAGAKANMKGTLVRIAVWITRPDALMKRAAGLWQQFNDEGHMELKSLGDNLARFELGKIDGLDPVFCSVITGWCREVAAAVGAVAAQARHVDCVWRGGAVCVWEVRFASVDPKDARGVSRRRE
jgi:hypothetical protein